MAKIVVVTSGKGGVGKTTTSASFSAGLALAGHKTAVIDFDVGLRNLDLIMGCERRVVYDFVNVIQGEATLNQALIKDKHCENLYVLAASQTRDKEALNKDGVEKVLTDLAGMGFEYIVCDSPAGIETGALIIDRPLRGGQQVYARGRDVIVMSMVNAGAEVIADGSIHVYAPLRGKAIAGARGNTEARIVSLCLEPELLSIAGVYRTSDVPLPAEILGKPTQVRLVGGSEGKLVMDPIDLPPPPVRTLPFLRRRGKR